MKKTMNTLYFYFNTALMEVAALSHPLLVRLAGTYGASVHHFMTLGTVDITHDP